MSWSLWAKRLQSLAQQSPADSPAHGAQAGQGSFPLLLPFPSSSPLDRPRPGCAVHPVQRRIPGPERAPGKEEEIKELPRGSSPHTEQGGFALREEQAAPCEQKSA